MRRNIARSVHTFLHPGVPSTKGKLAQANHLRELLASAPQFADSHGQRLALHIRPIPQRHHVMNL